MGLSDPDTRPSSRWEASLSTNPAEESSRNYLLASLDRAGLSAMKPHLETIRLEQDEVLFESDSVLAHVYFPETTGISLLSTKEGRTMIAGTVGREGMVGLGVFLGQVTSTLRASVHVAGVARRMTAAAFQRLAAAPGPLHQLVLQYTSTFLGQILETHRCTVAHTVDRRCANWLLLTSERAQTLDLPLDMEVFARVVGVQREAIGVSLRSLQRRGLIDYNRSRIQLLDEAGLEEVSCKCFRTFRA